MSINLKSDAKIAVAKIYSLESKEKQIVNQKFDKLYSQERMQYSFKSTTYDYFVFVIWRTIFISDQESMKKKRVVVDIRALNKIAEIDTYSMSLQFDIIFSMIECEYISTIDATTFFHQWLIKLLDRHKFTVVTHRKQEQFNVEMMSFKNISAYVQREIDNILWIYKNFCRAYINDIVIFSKTLKKRVKHLHSRWPRRKEKGCGISHFAFSEKNFFSISLFACEKGRDFLNFPSHMKKNQKKMNFYLLKWAKSVIFCEKGRDSFFTSHCGKKNFIWGISLFNDPSVYI